MASASLSLHSVSIVARSVRSWSLSAMVAGAAFEGIYTSNEGPFGIILGALSAALMGAFIGALLGVASGLISAAVLRSWSGVRRPYSPRVLWIPFVAGLILGSVGYYSKPAAESSVASAPNTILPMAPLSTRTPRVIATPSGAPEDTVKAFYGSVSARKYADAYALLSASFQHSMPYDSFQHGYANTKNLFYKVHRDSGNAVSVALVAVDRINNGSDVSSFKGTWHLVPSRDGSRWLMDEGDFTKVADKSFVTTPTPATPGTAGRSTLSGQTVPNSDAPPAGGVESDCEDVGVQGVYGDGEILELDDGRKLRVSGADQAISGVWVAPFDGMICDAGGTLINKDDNEKVDLLP